MENFSPDLKSSLLKVFRTFFELILFETFVTSFGPDAHLLTRFSNRVSSFILPFKILNYAHKYIIS
jgi:hypothetical protein